MIKEHDRVVLTESVPAYGLEPGDVGTVVHVYADGKAYEVEFVALDGHTRAHRRSPACLDLLQERRTALISAAVTGKIDVAQDSRK